MTTRPTSAASRRPWPKANPDLYENLYRTMLREGVRKSPATPIN